MTQVTLDETLFVRLQTISATTGMDIDVLAGHIIKDGLGRIDTAGGFSISTKDGSIRYGHSSPTPVVQASVVRDQGMVREIDMSAFK